VRADLFLEIDGAIHSLILSEVEIH
jgi:hypothetical protein